MAARPLTELTVRAASGAGLKLPKYDISGALKEVDAAFAPILKEAKELEEFSAKRAKEIEAEIAAVDRDIVRWPCSALPPPLSAPGELA